MRKIIDIHSHMFNIKYLPVAGILRRYSNNKISHLVAKGVEWLILKGVDESYSNNHKKNIKLNGLENFDSSVNDILKLENRTYNIDDVIDFNIDDTIDAMIGMASTPDLEVKELSDAIDEFEKMNPDNSNEIINIRTQKISAMSSIQKSEFLFYRARIFRRMLNWVVRTFKKIKDHIKWFIFMRNSEEVIYKHITKVDEKGVEKYLHLMMDVDYFFNDNGSKRYKSNYDFETEQIPNMQKLNSKHNNLIGFVAFNPSRDNCMEIVKSAIENKGFKGVKFYPPLGYRACKNHNEKYETRIDTLLQYCVVNEIPLFTHCNNKGFEANPDSNSGYDANPKYWEKVLEKYENLILCLGHGGGTEGWFAENRETDKVIANEINSADTVDDSKKQKENWNHSYAALVFKLCVKYDNVYCDASYLDDMINSKGNFVKIPKNNFKKRLVELFNSEPVFSQKIMYGSDWHMLFREGKNKVYLKLYKDFFSENELIGYSKDFFYNNAVRFLKLEDTFV